MTTTYVAPDYTGTGSHVRVTVTDEQMKAFGDEIERIFKAGVARYGSVDEFQRALCWYNEIKRQGRAA